jgi:hypothetical protein
MAARGGAPVIGLTSLLDEPLTLALPFRSLASSLASPSAQSRTALPPDETREGS